jgi:putative transposase
VDLMAEASDGLPMRILGLCLMPNHFHLALWPAGDGDLSAWMRWLMTTQVARYRRHYHNRGIGHVWQGRFKAFPVQSSRHLLDVLCYIERNPVRAGLVERAADWPWSSAAMRAGGAELLSRWPVRRPADWAERISRAEPPSRLRLLRLCGNRSRPYGDGEWTARTADALGLGSSLRPQGRPRKTEPDTENQ